MNSSSTAKDDGLDAVYQYFHRMGLGLSKSRFMSIDRMVFEGYTRLEARKNRDIADETKYKALVRRLFPALANESQNRIAHRANELFWKIVVDNYRLKLGAVNCLKSLQRRGLTMGIVSNHKDAASILKTLRKLGIRNYFETVVVSAEVGVRKPNPEIFRIAISALHEKCEGAAFVGDSLEHDVLGAHQAGLTAILLRNYEPSMINKDASRVKDYASEFGIRLIIPDYVVNRLGDIPDIISSIGKGEPDVRAPRR